MADEAAGKESFRNNLDCADGNQKEKVMEEKVIEELVGFPDLPVSSPPPSLAGNIRRQVQAPTPHVFHSIRSDTEPKALLYNAPPLTPSVSQEALHPASGSGAHGGFVPPPTFSPNIFNNVDNPGASALTQTSSTQAPLTLPTNTQPSPGTARTCGTNYLSRSKAIPQSLVYPAPGMLGHNGIMFLPISYIPTGQPALPLAMVNQISAGGIPVPVSLSIGQGSAPSPLTATYRPGTQCSRNILPNVQEPSPPTSEENNSQEAGSYSIFPDNNTRLLRLRKPILNWMRRKLDNDCPKNWEDLADVRGWNYEDIIAHDNDCRRNRDSPFLKLLETENFHTYTVDDFLKDMKIIERKDILSEFGSIFQTNKS